MTNQVNIVPSILSADFMRLGAELEDIGEADLLHYDVMDGHFVPNLSFGPGILKQVRAHTHLPLDVHLMVTNPEGVFDSYIGAGADIVTFHVEAAENPDELIERIRAQGVSAGISLSPDTPAEAVLPYLEKVDLVLVMTVYPGFGGQKLIEATLPKIKTISGACLALGRSPMIEVDGGIAPDTIARVSEAGADTFVAGSAIFDAVDRGARMAELRRLAEGI
ncbi:ribulose-phosphate 3-epimerase [Coriobacteriales bacterium OH1046]|nr:ribulose-phosphate 3-epimerase [Coriobacteriales bacterium OH1046]